MKCQRWHRSPVGLALWHFVKLKTIKWPATIKKSFRKQIPTLKVHLFLPPFDTCSMLKKQLEFVLLSLLTTLKKLCYKIHKKIYRDQFGLSTSLIVNHRKKLSLLDSIIMQKVFSEEVGRQRHQLIELSPLLQFLIPTWQVAILSGNQSPFIVTFIFKSLYCQIFRSS